MNDFMYLFRGGDTPPPNETPEQAQAHMKRWLEWVNKLAEAGKVKVGEPLEVSGKTITGKDQLVTDGPFAEGKELVGGFLIVTCRDIDEATDLARECPVFLRDGSVEIRPINRLEYA